MKKIFFITIYIICALNLFSQKVQLSGYVSDYNTGEKLIGALVFVNNNVVSTNNFGFYTIESSATDSIKIRCSFIGYVSESITIANNFNNTINFELKSGIELQEVIINSQKTRLKEAEMGSINLSISQIRLLPTLGAESDILKAIQILPGVEGGTEGSSGIYVRGGSIDQNLILLDDVSLYYVNHLGGFISTFNSDAISNVKLIKGSYSARYGGRLSSVVDIRMKDGNQKKITGTYSIGTATSKFLLEGPIKKDKSSFLISARGFLWGFLYGGLSRLIMKNSQITYNFYDFNAKYSTKIDDKNRLYLSFYTGGDQFIPRVLDVTFGESITFPIKWGNFLTALRWNKIYNSKIFSNTTFSYTRYGYSNSFKYSDLTKKTKAEQSFNSAINDLTLKYDLQYNVTNNYNIKTGFEEVVHFFTPGNLKTYEKINDTVYADTLVGNPNITTNEINFYVENQLDFFNFINLNLGLRFSNYFSKKMYYNLEPHLLASIIFNENNSIKLSYVNNHQYVHLLTSNTVGMPVDIWVPSTENVKPEFANQYSLGYYYAAENYNISIETYYKKMNNLVSLSEGITAFGVSKDWEKKIETDGIGTSYGFELLIEKNIGKVTGLIAYTYANSTRQFKNINNGKPFPYKYDRRHSVNAFFSFQINENIDFSLNWTFGTGYPYTLALGKYTFFGVKYNGQILPGNILLYSDINQYRMANFHHLDIAYNISKKVKRGIRTWTISIYNIYNRANPFYYFIRKDDSNGDWHLYQQSLFPIIPTISYSLKF